MVAEEKRDLTSVKATQKTEQDGVTQQENQIALQDKELQKATTSFENKQLGFMNDVLALGTKIAGTVQKTPSDQAAKASLNLYNQKIGDQEIIKHLIVDQKALIATPLNKRTQPEGAISTREMSLSRVSQNF